MVKYLTALIRYYFLLNKFSMVRIKKKKKTDRVRKLLNREVIAHPQAGSEKKDEGIIKIVGRIYYNRL